MGEIIKAECTECGTSWDLRLGYGLSHGLNDNIILEFPEDRRKELKEKLESHDNAAFSFRAASCSVCHNLVAAPVLSNGSDGIILVSGNCPVCGSEKVEQYVEEKPLCPRCGNNKIILKETGYWD